MVLRGAEDSLSLYRLDTIYLCVSKHDAVAKGLQLEAPLALVLDLLGWVSARRRTYRETMDAWRTSCPRLPVWEDCQANGLVAVTRGELDAERVVVLTAKGHAFAERHARR
jgi:hypothetical protein